MRRLILLDAGPLGMACNPTASPLADRANLWVESLVRREVFVAIPEIADYEVRRELLRARKIRGIAILNLLKDELLYIPITTETILRAAEFWAKCRNEGYPLADPRALDGDVILAAQAVEVASDYDETVIATTNPDHLSRLVDARHWEEIT
ncbi:MAG: nucleic acid-binding protein [Armatimonadetes bacterium]|nr:nucleic acid-binding protein [Armatimonadota bacterium]